MAEKKYISLSKLSTFLDKLSGKFAALIHTHKLSDITDYVVDSELSSTSVNPVQNKVIDAEFEAISIALDIYEKELESKANTVHSHDDLYYTISDVDGIIAQKAQVQIVTWGADD